MKNPLYGAIITYNGLLADGYRRQDMNHMIHAATPQRALKAYYHMAALGEGGVKMDSVLKKIEFTEQRDLGENKAQVTSREVWEYRYISIVNGDQSPWRTINYTVRYTMEKDGAKWLVANATILYSDRDSDAGDLDFFNRPADVPQGSVPSKPKTGIMKGGDIGKSKETQD
ncbi:MAG: hypothetical protein OEY01_14150 [Desulfobulbaceae bacterium]|nr:hypothetical protein [Desulfobulbaceae bacterium]